MRALDHKLLRDLARLKGQVLTIALVVACGVATFVTMVSAYGSLRFSQLAYYDQARFPDVFASVRRAPRSLEARIAEIPGVAVVETRVIEEVSLDVPNLAEPAIGRMVSVPTDRPQLLGRLMLRRGRPLEPGHRDEVLINESFAKARKLEPGDAITAVVNGRRQTFRIAGIALSPEYIFAFRAGDAIPDDTRFGILWVDRDALSAAFDMDGAFNDVVIGLAPGAKPEPVKRELERLLTPYGNFGAYGREDQTSHKFIDQELTQLMSWATVGPAIFLGVAAFLLNIVLSRLIGTQRGQIATIKAFGYTNFAIALHYFQLLFVMVLLGSVIGTGLGIWLGHALNEMYGAYFRFPVQDYRLESWVLVVAVLVTLLASAIGGLSAVRRATSLSPAAAMQPPAPPRYTRTILDRLGLSRLLSQPSRIIVRAMQRRPLRTVLSIVGIALSVGIVVIGQFFTDATDSLILSQFTWVQRDDATVVFVRPLERRALDELAHVPGVMRVEGFRAVPIRLHAGHRQRTLGLMGLPKDSDLRRVVGSDPKPIVLPANGVVLTDYLARLLDVRKGDRVRIEVLEGDRREREVEVVGEVDEVLGLNAYMRLDALHHLLGEESAISGAFLKLDSRMERDVSARLKTMPMVASATLKSAALRSFKETQGNMVLVMSTILTAFAITIAVGVVYNTARIALAERERELASLRVLGFTRLEVTSLLLGELAIEVMAGIPIGFFVGRAFLVLMMKTVSAETYRFAIVVEPRVFGAAALTIVVAGLISALLVRRRLDRLDLVSVLKTRE